VFGVASPLGRYADVLAFNNTPYAVWLEDKAYDAGWRSGEQERGHGRPRSAAAAAMIEHGLKRNGRGPRRIHMTESAHAALLAYLEEKLCLMREIAVVADRGRRERREIRRIHERVVRRHILATERAIERLRYAS
jgi:hypothetical protein